MSAAYRIENLVFGYGGPPVLTVDRLVIPEGRIIALVGPNGSGKTTFLHILAFLELAGTIHFFGNRVSRENLIDTRRRAALLLQNPYLFHSSVLMNLMWGLRIRGISKSKARNRALEALEQVGLRGFERRPARSLSGGESQRVALARSLVLEPDVLLLDEPANHLDVQSVERTWQIVQEINRDSGTTVVLATHNVSMVQAFVSSFLHLSYGTVIPAPPDNLFRGTVRGDGITFDTGRIAVRMPTRTARGTHMAIDPSGIVLADGPTNGSASGSFPGCVAALRREDSGAITVEVDVGERLRLTINPERAGDPPLRLGQQVYLSIPPEAVTVF